LKKLFENFAVDYSLNGTGNVGNVAYAVHAAICESCLCKLHFHAELAGDSQMEKKGKLCVQFAVRVRVWLKGV
jgi:hypothetical protein